MRESVKAYFEQAKQWNLTGAPWWIVDLQDDPDTLHCSEQFALLFGLNPAATSHSLATLFPSDPSRGSSASSTDKSTADAAEVSAFLGLDHPHKRGEKLHSSTFNFFDKAKTSYTHFTNAIRVLEQDEQGTALALYGVVEDIKKSSLGRYETLFDRYFDELITEHGYGYKWVVDLENLQIMPDASMALMHGEGWVAGQWYPFVGIYDRTPEQFRAMVKADTDQYRRDVEAGLVVELNVVHPHIHAQTGKVHWYNVRGRHVVIEDRPYSVGISIDVTEQHLAKQVLQEKLAREQLLSSSGHVGKWCYDVETQMVTYDECLCSWIGTGIAADEPCGLDQVMSTMTDTQKATFVADVERGISELLIQRSADEYSWEHSIWDRVVRVVARCVEQNGRLTIVGLSFDITDLVKQKQLAQEQSRKAENAAELGGIGQFEFDIVNNITSANQALRDIFQFSVGEYPEVTLADIESRYPEDKKSEYRRSAQKAFASEAGATLERSLSLPDGTSKQVRVKLSPKHIDGRMTSFLGTVVDVTNEIERQQQLEEMLCEREDMMRRQQKMFAIIGHELRTPVSAVSMLIQDDQIDTAQKLEQLSEISAGLLNVIDDLRLVSNPGETRKVQLEVENPERVIIGALGSLKKVFQDRSVQVHTSIEKSSLNLRIPVQSLRQTVTNLAKNAALHSDGKNIYVSLSYSETHGSGLLATLRVEDDGKGIKPEKRARLFEAFERGNSQQDGSGLGLYIVRTLTTKMDGAVSCTASRYGGACFSVTFPVSRASIVESDLVAQPELSLDGMRILLAEDEATLRLMTGRMLTKRGAEVTCCQDGAEALEVFKKGHFDLLLTDMMMPRMDGVALTQTVREIAPEFPIIAVTAAVLGTESDKLKVAGVNAVVAKPITASVLQKTLHELAIE